MAIKRWRASEWAMAMCELQEDREAVAVVRRWAAEKSPHDADTAKVDHFLGRMRGLLEARAAHYKKVKPLPLKPGK